MGFLGDIGRALVGMQPKGQAEMPPAGAVAGSANPYYDGNRKIVPEIDVVRLEVHENGNRLELWAHIKNHSNFEVEINKVAILGQTNAIGRFLNPGEQHEVRIYGGNFPTNDGYKKCEVFFKIVKNGDYFVADHTIEYDYGDGRYIPNDLHVIHPIRDV